MVVQIFEDPVTRRHFEGLAVVLKRDSSYDSGELIRARVLFVGTQDRCDRWINPIDWKEGEELGLLEQRAFNERMASWLGRLGDFKRMIEKNRRAK